jgi:hypothetical protein
MLLNGFFLSGCSGGGGGDGGGSTPYLQVAIDIPASTSISAASIDLSGIASCDACPQTEVAFGYCPAILAPITSSIDVTWKNRDTGNSGPTYHAITGRCNCLFSYCAVIYAHRWSASIPVAIGINAIEVRATDPKGVSGSDTISITRLPHLVTGLTAAGGHGQVTLNWDPVPGATSYNLYWGDSANVTTSTGTRIAGVSSPYVHTGLQDNATYYYTVTAVIDKFESHAADVVWATPGWLTEEIATTASSTESRTTSIAADSSGKAHVHYSFDEYSGNSVSMHNFYASNASGPWAPALVAQATYVGSTIALESGGGVHVGFLGFGGLEHAVNTGGTWAAEVVDPTGWCDASLALDSAAKVHMAYYSSTGGKVLRYATNASGNWASVDIDSFANIGCNAPRRMSVAVDSTGAVHLAYAGDFPNYGLKYATNQGGTWTVSTLDSDNVEQVSLALDLNGNSHIAYANNFGELKYMQGATGAWTLTVLANSGSPNHPALAMDTAGHAHLSYASGQSGGSLVYATDAAGSWQFVLVDAANSNVNGGMDTAIAVDTQGNLHISYVRDGNFRYATNK